jgi:hypothetical protein
VFLHTSFKTQRLHLWNLLVVMSSFMHLSEQCNFQNECLYLWNFHDVESSPGWSVLVFIHFRLEFPHPRMQCLCMWTFQVVVSFWKFQWTAPSLTISHIQLLPTFVVIRPSMMYRPIHTQYFYLIYSLSYVALSVTKHIQRRIKGWKVNDELGRIWREAVKA